MEPSDDRLEAFRRGERIRGGQSLHVDVVPGPCIHRHGWRTILCVDPIDIVECPDCGEQREARCNFDDEFA